MSEVEQKAREILKALGVKDISKGSGMIPTKLFPPQVARVIDEIETDTTPSWMNFRPNLIAESLDRVSSAQSLGLRSLFEKTCIKYQNPLISYTVGPIKITNVKYHALSFYLDGYIVNKITNRGTEGKKGTKTIRRWEDCPASNDDYSWNFVAGSADLATQWAHEFKEKTTNKVLGKISQNADPKIGKTISKNSYWKSGNLFDLIVQILTILITGGITTRNGYDVTLSYSWQGTKTQTKHIDKTVWLPVEGGIPWVWD